MIENDVELLEKEVKRLLDENKNGREIRTKKEKLIILKNLLTLKPKIEQQFNSLYQFSEKIGKHPSVTYSYFNGKLVPSTKVLLMIGRIMKLNEGWFKTV